MTIRHYGWPSSPFSAKTPAYFKSVGVDFQDIQPHVLTLPRRIQPAIGYVMMPTVELTDGICKTAVESSTTLKHYRPRQPFYQLRPSSGSPRLYSKFMPTNGFRSSRCALAGQFRKPTLAQSDFGRCAFPWLPSLLSRPFAKTMAKKMSSYLPILGITEDTTLRFSVGFNLLLTSSISISAPSPISLVIALRWQIIHSPHHSLPMFGEIRALGITSKTTQTS